VIENWHRQRVEAAATSAQRIRDSPRPDLGIFPVDEFSLLRGFHMTLRQLASHQRFGNLARRIRGQQLRGRRRRHAELHARLQANGKLRTGFEPVDEGDAVTYPLRDADDLADMLAEFGEPRLDLRNDIVVAGHNPDRPDAPASRNHNGRCRRAAVPGRI
jgi:hypothetical protein